MKHFKTFDCVDYWIVAHREDELPSAGEDFDLGTKEENDKYAASFVSEENISLSLQVLYYSHSKQVVGESMLLGCCHFAYDVPQSELVKFVSECGLVDEAKEDLQNKLEEIKRLDFGAMEQMA